MERWVSRERGYYNYFAKYHAKMTDGGVIEIGVVFEGEFFEIGGGERGKFPRTATNRHCTRV